MRDIMWDLQICFIRYWQDDLREETGSTELPQREICGSLTVHICDTDDQIYFVTLPYDGNIVVFPSEKTASRCFPSAEGQVISKL